MTVPYFVILLTFSTSLFGTKMNLGEDNFDASFLNEELRFPAMQVVGHSGLTDGNTYDIVMYRSNSVFELQLHASKAMSQDSCQRIAYFSQKVDEDIYSDARQIKNALQILNIEKEDYRNVTAVIPHSRNKAGVVTFVKVCADQ